MKGAIHRLRQCCALEDLNGVASGLLAGKYKLLHRKNNDAWISAFGQRLWHRNTVMNMHLN